MDAKVAEFLTKERICALSVVMPDGTCHGSAMHFAQDSQTSNIYFITEDNTTKYQAVMGGKTTHASVVVGFDETQMKTVQIDGTICQITDPANLEAVKQVYFAKHPGSKKFDTPTSVYLQFVPVKWKYSDYHATPPVFLQG